MSAGTADSQTLARASSTALDDELGTAAVRGDAWRMISIHSSDLVRALRRVVPVLPSRGGIPIHSCVRIQTADGGVLFAATDGIRAVRTTVAGEAGETVAVPGAVLAKIASTLPVGPVTLTPSKGRVEIKAGRARFVVPAFDAADLPPLHAAASEALLEVHHERLGAAIAAVRHAVSDDASRPALSGMLLEARADTMHAVAIDGHRLALHTSEHTAAVHGCAVLVPWLALPLLAALCAELHGESVTIARDQGYVLASAGSTTIAVREVEAPFPPYKKIIPADGRRGTRATGDRKALLDAVARVSIATSSTSGVRLEITADAVTLGAASPDVGDASDSVAAEVDGKSARAALAAQYLTDALRAGGAAEASISIAGELDPVVVDAGDTLSVIMPMRG